MRQFVDKHPDYKHDSVITKEINYDLIKAVDAMYVTYSPLRVKPDSDEINSEKGTLKAQDLLPGDYVGSQHDDGGYVPPCT
jgi:hypothetical protein